MDYIIVAYNNKNKCYMNVTCKNCSKTMAIYNFHQVYSNCVILNIIDL